MILNLHTFDITDDKVNESYFSDIDLNSCGRVNNVNVHQVHYQFRVDISQLILAERKNTDFSVGWIR